jgi:type IX secretion system PorP/SprF family membrane protein
MFKHIIAMKKIQTVVLLVITFTSLQFNASAQQQMENTMSQYFRNRMLWNPGFTGADGNKIYALQNRSWVGFQGAPVMTNISGELNFGENSAAGLQFMSDVTGLLYRTFGVFNYAYKVKLNANQNIHIGISLAFAGDRLNSRYIDQGGAVDPLIVASIDNKIQFDGNIGAVYTNKKLTLGLSFYRLRENFSSKSGGSANLALAQLGGSYNISIGGDEKLNLKPLAMLRLYRTTSALIDLGAQFEYNKQVNVMAVYQSTGNIRAGAGIAMSNLGEANFFYNTNIKVANAASQQYEIGIGFYLNKKK